MAGYKDTLTGVFGCPVDENPTVVMIEAAFRARNLRWKYLTIEVGPDDLKKAVYGAKAMGFRGFNLTIPHKIHVIPFLDEITPAARLIGAVNTVTSEKGILTGENTDGKGFLKALQEAHVEVKDKVFQMLGAGGAARAIGIELALAGAREIIIVNRDPEKGLDLSNHIGYNTPAHSSFLPWNLPVNVREDTDVFINATSIGLYPDNNMPDIKWDTLRREVLCCDVIPNPPNTPFLQKAKARGARTIDGLGMLVYQGAIGFKTWTGLDAPVEEMKKALEKAFG